jgi:hypothetical protein
MEILGQLSAEINSFRDGSSQGEDSAAGFIHETARPVRATYRRLRNEGVRLAVSPTELRKVFFRSGRNSDRW